MGKVTLADNTTIAAHSSNDGRPYSKPLIVLALQIVFLSALFSFYNVHVPFGPPLMWIRERVSQVPIVKSAIQILGSNIAPFLPKTHFDGNSQKRQQRIHNEKSEQRQQQKAEDKKTNKAQLPVVFSAAQLARHDGSDPSVPVYLAVLGNVFDVDKGRKHYGKGGGYHFFAGKDASRAFVTGDFSSKGLSADISGLSDNELLSIQDWKSFYEKEYRFVGLLAGVYYNQRGDPTDLMEQISARIEKAKQWKEAQTKEQEVFPPCNSEWKKGIGGRVWCTNKSGGVVREWVGVPRKLFSPGSNHFKCVCVKNFGHSLAMPDVDTGRGDLDHPALAEYVNCVEDSNSCRTPM